MACRWLVGGFRWLCPAILHSSALLRWNDSGAREVWGSVRATPICPARGHLEHQPVGTQLGRRFKPLPVELVRPTGQLGRWPLCCRRARRGPPFAMAEIVRGLRRICTPGMFGGRTARSVWSAPHPGAFGWPRILQRPKRRDAAHSKRFAPSVAALPPWAKSDGRPIRISDFGLRSGFGLRASDFGGHFLAQ